MINYDAFNKIVFSKVPEKATRILDVGCGTGNMGKALKDQNRNRRVDGITYSDLEYKIAKPVLNDVWIVDINNEIHHIHPDYDCIIFSHILEHTFYPENVLKAFSKLLSNDGVIIIALPNILHFKQRREFLKGKFRYSETGGLMDVTHFRFFDWVGAQQMIKNGGLNIVSKESYGSFPLPMVRKLLPGISEKIDQYSVKKWPGLFGFQFVFVAKK